MSFISDSSVLTFTLSDVDAGRNGQFDLSIQGDTVKRGQFVMDGLDLLTGPLNIDYESQVENDYKIMFEVIAVDKPEYGDAHTATAVVILEVRF